MTSNLLVWSHISGKFLMFDNVPIRIKHKSVGGWIRMGPSAASALNPPLAPLPQERSTSLIKHPPLAAPALPAPTPLAHHLLPSCRPFGLGRSLCWASSSLSVSCSQCLLILPDSACRPASSGETSQPRHSQGGPLTVQ